MTHDDGTTVDITEGVQVAYDTAYGSMDWGSGFLDSEEMGLIAHLGEACRFPSFEDALASVHRHREQQERAIAYREEQRRKQAEQDARILAEHRQTEQARRLRVAERLQREAARSSS